jgi:hypothetical protein
MDAKGFELLMAAKILGEGGGVSMDAKGFERLMAAKILGKGGGGGKIEELEGIPPLTFTANGRPLLDYLISGNTVQTGTPTPENPVIPEGVGEFEMAGAHAGQYKLPILSNSTVTNIYLGEVETTRRIKKLVLTGEETWIKRVADNANYTFQYNMNVRILRGLCSHYAGYVASQIDKIDGIYLDYSLSIIITDLRFTAETDFKSYLAAQYAAGTPVTVWYVLAEPETAVVNEPLMKIDDYADTISMEQASVSIPSNKGSTTLDVDTTIEPSNVYIKYRS